MPHARSSGPGGHPFTQPEPLDVHFKCNPQLLAEDIQKSSIAGVTGIVTIDQFREFAFDLRMFFLDRFVFLRGRLGPRGLDWYELTPSALP